MVGLQEKQEFVLYSRPLLSSGNLGEKFMERETLNSEVWDWMPFETFEHITLIATIAWLQPMQ